MTSPFAAEDCPFEMVARKPRGAVAGAVLRITGYRERVRRHLVQREPASLVVPLVVNFGEPFRIGLGRAPTEDDRHGSFAAGLFAGPVQIESFGAALCLQIDFTPLGARRFFGVPMSDLADRMLPLDAILGNAGIGLRERLGNVGNWEDRFDLAERFVADRIAGAADPAPELDEAYRRIEASGGQIRIARLAEHVGWSRKHLVDRFKREIGMGPKTVARLARFGRAVAAAQRDPGWADIAADCGFSDQAHMTREFQALAGLPPTALFPRAA
jgi:AraC-like DNA-binding protein